MATKLNALKTEEDFRRQQINLAAHVFPRTPQIIVFTVLLLIWLTLSKIHKTGDDHPLFLNNEVLFSFALFSVFGILLNLFAVLMNLLSRINEAKFNQAVAPGVEFIDKCLANQVKIIRALELANRGVYLCCSFVWIYAFAMGVNVGRRIYGWAQCM